MLRVGVDVGGTHTDIVMVDDDTGKLSVHKVPTTVADPSIGAVAGVKDLCDAAGVTPEAVEYFMHGTTVATNIALEHTGARCGLITTGGFRDLLHIARHRRPQTFSLQLDLPWQKYPLVRRRWRVGVAERVVPPGDIHVPLDEEAVRAAARQFREDGVEAVSVCFLFAFLNPAHEKRAGEILAKEMPDAFISLSHEVVPQYREYERFSTTALNSYVGPKTGRYLGRLSESLKELGVSADLHLMQSGGGAATHSAASRKPVSLLMSGPAAGVLGGIYVGKSAGYPSVITLDVGGTSADIGVAPNGEVLYKHILDTKIGPYQSMVPMIEVDAIGAGGGSIAYVDEGGQFQVGPQSAGSDPGPACYGRGGENATVTDCLVVLGRLDPDRFLGGKLKLRKDLAEQAVQDKLASKLGTSNEQSALGAIRILTHNMVQAIEVNSVRRGFDPRDFSLVAFGGGGPLFGCEIAREMAIPLTIFPPAPGLTSALGLLTTDVAYDQSRTVTKFLSTVDTRDLDHVLSELSAELRVQLEEDGFAEEDMRFERFAECRYKGQGYELRIPLPDGHTTLAAAVRENFDAAHTRAYGKAFPARDVEIVTLRATGSGRIPQITPNEIAVGTKAPEPEAISAWNEITFQHPDGGEATRYNTPRYDRRRLKAGNQITGPAIIEQMDSTIILPPDFTAEVDQHGNVLARLIESEVLK
jgi:5-oxoprolinase (ATP-hydrolysing)/N-methylhydantoinase A